MNVLLLAITILSIAAAIGGAVVTWRSLREERRRSRARIAALADAIDNADCSPQVAVDTGGVDATRTGMFELQTSGVQAARLIKAGVGLLMSVVIIVAVAMANRPSPAVGTDTAAAALNHGQRNAAPLELVSMRHARDGNTFTVSGLVRNPRSGARIEHITAVVFAFDRSGTFVASGRALLEFLTLDAGDESPFVVPVPNVPEVGRYRVSFRSESGLVRHLDRRSDQARLAAAQIH
jgi:hypothetical protein